LPTLCVPFQQHQPRQQQPKPNIRIDDDLVEACADDLRDACSADPSSFKDDAARARAVACLQTLRDELASPACRDKVRRKMARAARDVRLDDVLAEACAEDRKALCNDVQPVRAVLGGGYIGVS
jgi:hypothetical protein